jgi:hypothetical protein
MHGRAGMIFFRPVTVFPVMDDPRVRVTSSEEYESSSVLELVSEYCPIS